MTVSNTHLTRTPSMIEDSTPAPEKSNFTHTYIWVNAMKSTTMVLSSLVRVMVWGWVIHKQQQAQTGGFIFKSGIGTTGHH